MHEISINSITDLETLAKKLSQEIKPGCVLLLTGELGAGKTSFVQAFSRALGISEPVRSPTFIIHNEYKIHDKIEIHHLDLYRLTNSDELKELRIKDSITNNSYTFIEWADKFPIELETMFKGIQIYKIDFDVIDENERLVKFDKL